jgi:hypothetical protein
MDDIEAQPRYDNATEYFHKHFNENIFEYACNVCDRLWFEKDLKQVTDRHLDILSKEFVNENVSQFKVCTTCWIYLNKQQIPVLFRSNGFVYPPYPTVLPPRFHK